MLVPTHRHPATLTRIFCSFFWLYAATFLASVRWLCTLPIASQKALDVLLGRTCGRQAAGRGAAQPVSARATRQAPVLLVCKAPANLVGQRLGGHLLGVVVGVLGVQVLGAPGNVVGIAEGVYLQGSRGGGRPASAATARRALFCLRQASSPAAACPPQPTWSMLKNTGCMIQYWKPAPSTDSSSPCSSAVSRMPPMADSRMTTNRPSCWVEMPIKE